MSVPVFSITKRDGRSVVVFKRDGIVEGWAYLDEMSEKDRAEILHILETQEMNDLRKIDVKEMAKGLRQPAPEAAYKKGDVIGGQYEVRSLLGRGGFGEVYLVFTRMPRVVLALKTFRQEFLADAEAKENFKREALVWLNLEDHPFILAARFVDERSGRLFVGMDYIAPDDRGRVSLADHLARAQGPLETDQALLWASMFCYGMEHANQRGIKSHRDIKPTNILIRQDGTLLISDFGLAAAAEVAWKGRGGSWESAGEEGFVGLSLFQTVGKRVCGTPGYLAPEVFRGEGADVRSDIYSFGLVLWQMAAGSQAPPFAVGVAPPRSPRDTERYALEIYEGQMRNRAPAVGEPLEAVIERCLAAEPSKRFASFTGLRVELERALQHRTGRIVVPPPVGERDSAFWIFKGVSFIALGRHDDAVVCFVKALQMDPHNAIAHNNLGKALSDRGDLDGAIVEWRTAVRLQPDDAVAHNNVGKALYDKGDLDGAIAEYRAAVGHQPNFALAHSNLGKVLFDRGDLDGAISEYRTAICFEPDLALAHQNLGVALHFNGDLDGAIAEYRTTLRLQPDDAMTHNNLGIELQAKGDLDAAIIEYHAAVRLQPDNAKAHTNLGSTLYAKGDLDGAIGEWRTAVRLQPDAIAHHNLGKVLSDKGDLDGAIAEYRTTVRLQPDDAMAHTNLGTALWTKGDREAALEEFHRACSLVGFNQLAEQLISKRQWVAARSLLEEAIRHMPMDWKPVQNDSVTFRARICACWDKEEFLAYVGAKRAEGNLDNKWIAESYSKAWLQLAVIAVEEGNLKNALICIESGLALEPDHPLLWSERGFILARQAQYADALRSYQRAATVRDWAPPYQIAKALRGQGATLVELKRIDEAEEAIKRSLVLDPTSKIGRNELEYIIQLRRVCKEKGSQ